MKKILLSTIIAVSLFGCKSETDNASKTENNKESKTAKSEL